MVLGGLCGSETVDKRVVKGAFGVLWLWAFRGCRDRPCCCGLGVVASLVWGLLWRAVLAEAIGEAGAFGLWYLWGWFWLSGVLGVYGFRLLLVYGFFLFFPLVVHPWGLCWIT